MFDAECWKNERLNCEQKAYFILVSMSMGTEILTNLGSYHRVPLAIESSQASAKGVPSGVGLQVLGISVEAQHYPHRPQF